MYCIGDANGKYMLAHAASAQVRHTGEAQHDGGGQGAGGSCVGMHGIMTHGLR